MLRGKRKREEWGAGSTGPDGSGRGGGLHPRQHTTLAEKPTSYEEAGADASAGSRAVWGSRHGRHADPGRRGVHVRGEAGIRFGAGVLGGGQGRHGRHKLRESEDFQASDMAISLTGESELEPDPACRARRWREQGFSLPHHPAPASLREDEGAFAKCSGCGRDLALSPQLLFSTSDCLELTFSCYSLSFSVRVLYFDHSFTGYQHVGAKAKGPPTG